MKMSEHLPQTDWLETELASMSSAGDSLAKISAMPGRGQASQGSDPAYGMNSTGSLKKSTRATRSSKTYQPFAIEDWTLYSGASLRSGMTRSGTVYPLQPLALLTAATASGSPLIATPTTKANQLCPSMLRDSPGCRAIWPTPTSRDWKDTMTGRAPPSRQKSSQQTLGQRVSAEGHVGGHLNPPWVEWLMGFPLGHTDLKPSEMPSSRKSQKSSAKR